MLKHTHFRIVMLQLAVVVMLAFLSAYAEADIFCQEDVDGDGVGYGPVMNNGDMACSSDWIQVGFCPTGMMCLGDFAQHDNCPTVYNPDQTDINGDGAGDACLGTTAQTITVTTPAPATIGWGGSFNVAATASSGLAVSITTSGGCTGSGLGSATITMASSGHLSTCTVSYNQAGNINYAAASTVTSQTGGYHIAKFPQTITVTTPAPIFAAENTIFSVAATASSGLPVSITSSGGCSGSGSGNATITMTSGTTSCTVLYDQAGNNGYSAAIEVRSTTTAIPSRVKNDFNGDNKSDVLFLNTATSTTKYWSDASKSQSIYVGTYSSDYSYAGSGDFDGDGKADLFFTKASNRATLVWSGAVKAAATYPGTSAAGFTLAAICDLDGDSKDDVVWFNPTTGKTQVWSGAVKASITYPGTQSTAYSVAACADFDGNGKADLFWHNSSTGANQIWLSANKSAKLYPGTSGDLAWIPFGAGDIDGDGKADMVWYNASTNGTMVWKGGLKSAISYPGTGTSGFTPKAIGDYNGDGKADLFWVNDSTLATQIWPGVVKSAMTYPGNSPAGFGAQK